MGIIKSMLSEAVVRHNGWVKFIKRIDAMDPTILIDHKVIGNVIQYDLSKYYYGIHCKDDTLLNKLTKMLNIDGHSTYIFDRIIFCEDKEDEFRYLWFDMDKDFHSNHIGSGFYKYAQPIKGDKLRKAIYKTNDRAVIPGLSREEELIRLAELYPDLFLKTVKTKTGFIQDKVDLIPSKIIDFLKNPGYSPNKRNFTQDEIEYIVKLQKDYKKLEQDIEKAVNDVGRKIHNDDYHYFDLDLKYVNVGYDKDGKLKAFDI